MTISLRTLDLPPPFRLVALREAGDAFAHACAHAAEFGAGTLVFIGRFDLAEFAVVLEPEEPLASARRSFYAGMTALAGALAALAPPKTPITIEWPDRLKVGCGHVGGGRLGWPARADEQARPDWLVFGAIIHLVSMRSSGASLPRLSSLEDEGFSEVGAERLVEGFARRLMAAIDRWQAGEFGATARDYLAHLRSGSGAPRWIDARGNLWSEAPSEVATSSDLRVALSAPSWLDRDSVHSCGYRP